MSSTREQRPAPSEAAAPSAAELVELGDANARGLIPHRRGRARSRSELWRLHTAGRRNAAGERVCLRVVREGRTVYTTARWIDEYFAALAIAPPAASPRERRRRSFANTRSTPLPAAAAATLRRHGLDCSAGGAGGA